MEVKARKAEEFVDAPAVASSFDVDRDAMTIEPVVNGQQLMTLLCAGEGIASCVNSVGLDFAAASDRFAPLRLALQHACACIEPDMCAIAGASAELAVSMSRIALWA